MDLKSWEKELKHKQYVWVHVIQRIPTLEVICTLLVNCSFGNVLGSLCHLFIPSMAFIYDLQTTNCLLKRLTTHCHCYLFHDLEFLE
jgi:hypothetical protein